MLCNYSIHISRKNYWRRALNTFSEYKMKNKIFGYNGYFYSRYYGGTESGWLSLLVARARPERLAGLVLIAAAPDFTERMLLKGLSTEDRITLERDGRLERPSQYSHEPSVFTWKLIEEGRDHLLLDKKLALPCPVRLLHGQSDPDVPWEYSLQIAQHLEAPEVVTTFVKDGDHRLSTPADIARLIATVEELAG